MSPAEIVLRVSEPETYSRAPGKFLSLDAWSIGRGEVGPKWRFRIAVRGEARRPLVPDIAFVSTERFSADPALELEAPAFSPMLVVEILSPTR